MKSAPNQNGVCFYLTKVESSILGKPVKHPGPGLPDNLSQGYIASHQLIKKQFASTLNSTFKKVGRY